MVLIGTFLEGELFLLLVGVMAKTSFINPVISLPFAVLGAFLHEIIYFWLGRWKGRKLLLGNSLTKRKYRKTKKLIHKHEILSLFIIRFLYGMRLVPMILFGASKYNILKFSIVNTATLLIWSATYIAIGFIYGMALDKHMEKFNQHLLLTVFAIIIIGIAYHLIMKWGNKKANS